MAIQATIATYNRQLNHYYWAFRHHWGSNAKIVCMNVFKNIENSNSKVKLQKRDHNNLKDKIKKISSAIQLSWHHELALVSYPHIDSSFYETPFSRIAKGSPHKERQHFIAWRANQAYYALYSAASATLRCFKIDEFAHDQMVREFNFNCLREYSPDLFIYPFSLYLSRFKSSYYSFYNPVMPPLINSNSDANCKTDDFKSSNCFKGIKKVLAHTYKYQKDLIDQKIIRRKSEPDREFSFLSYMKMMRERLTYSAVEELVELGEHTSNVPVYFDIALVNLTCFFLFCCEVLLAYYLGKEELKKVFDIYKANISKINSVITCFPLEMRAGIWGN